MNEKPRFDAEDDDREAIMTPVHVTTERMNAIPLPHTWRRRLARGIALIYLAHSAVVPLSAIAQVTPAASAGSGTKPLVDGAANGVPVVNIAPPSRAGVSRNQYDQFNVGDKGLILNNAGQASQTQLGGWIAGNPQLGTQNARIILNEVVSGNASRLGGAMEVAGKRADVVVANPNGIACDGCGFINTGRATLVTGMPQFGSDGALTNFRVGDGQLVVGAGGLDGKSLEQLDLIARGMTVEGEVWTQRLNAITGANNVQYNTLQATGAGATGTAPTFAIDIKDIGGMYANQIYMVATESGLGVNSRGRLAALQDNLRLSSAGDLTLADTSAHGDVELDAAGRTTLTGQTWSDNALRITGPNGVTNQGEMVGSRVLLQTNDLINSGRILQQAQATLTVNAARIQNSGTLSSGGALNVKANILNGDTGIYLAQGDVALGAQQISLANATISANGLASVMTPGALSLAGARITAQTDLHVDAGGALDAHGAVLQSAVDTRISAASLDARSASIVAGRDLGVTATGALDSTGGQLLGGGAVQISAAHLDNTSGQLSGNGTVVLQTNGLVNAGGLISGQILTIDAGAGTVDNRGGTLASDDTLSVRAAQLNNGEGTILSQADVALTTTGKLANTDGFIQGRTLAVQAGQLTNTDGIVLARNNLDINSVGSVDNTRGVLQGNAVSLSAAKLINVYGAIQGQSLTLSFNDVDNTHGVLVSDSDLTLRGNGAFTNTNGLVQGKNLTLDSGSLTNAGGQLIGERSLELSTGTLTNTAGTVVAIDGIATVTAGTVDNSQGLITSSQGTQLSATSFTNTQGEVSSGSALTVDTGSGELRNSGGALVAVGGAKINAGNLTNDADGTIQSGGDLDITALQLVNRDALVWSGGALNVDAHTLDNTRGQMGAADTIRVDTQRFTNASGIVSGKDLTLTAVTLDNTGGTLGAANDLALDSSGAVVNDGGRIQAARVTIDGQGLSNVNGEVSGTQSTSLDLGQGSLTNTGGQLVGQEALTLTASRIDNTNGLIGTTGALTLTTPQAALTNKTGHILAGTALVIDAASLQNDDGVIAATRGDVTVNTHDGGIDNTAGAIQAAGALNITGGDLVNGTDGILSAQTQTLRVNNLANDGGQILALDTLDITTANNLDNHGGLIQSVNRMDLSVGGTLANRNSGDTGGIFSGSELTVRARDLSNDNAVIGANDALTINLTGVLDNEAGVFTSNGTLSVTADALRSTGLVGAQGDTTIIATQGVQNVDGGSMVSNGQLTVHAREVDNSGGTFDANTIAVNADALANAGGAIRAGEDATVTVQSLNNDQGLISAQRDLTVSAPQLSNEGGQLLADRTLDLHTAQSAWGGKTAAGDTLALTIDGDYRNTGELAADNNLSITANNIDNSGKISAGNALSVATGNLTNSGEIAAQQTYLAVTGTLNNTDTGLIDGVLTHIEASALNNTGRIYGDWLEIGADTVNNNGRGVIAAREDLQLGARQINNSEGALIYSLGDATLAGALDADGNATGASQALQNASARIEAARTLTISTQNLRNVDTHITTRTVTSDPVETIIIRPNRGFPDYPASSCTGIGTDWTHCIVHPDKYGLRQTVTPVYTIIRGACHGGSEGSDAGCEPDIYIPNYTWDSDIFARFGVIPLNEAPPLEPGGAGGCTESYYDGEQTATRDVQSVACMQWRDDYAGWYGRFQAVLDELALPLNAYNAEVNEDNSIDSNENYTILRTVATESHTEVDSAAPAQILSGRDMYIYGSGTNENSQIVAGASLYVLGGTIRNDALQGVSTTTYDGSTSQRHFKYSGNTNKHGVDPEQPMVMAPKVITTELASFRYDQNAANPTESRTIEATDHSGEGVSTPGANTAAPMLQKIVKVDPRGKAVTSKGATQTDYSLPTLRVVDAANVPGQTGQTAESHEVVVSMAPKAQVPGNNLFVIHAAPDSHYLVETDPRFTNYRNFLSSDYFFTQLKLDPNYQMKRYGDGFTEQQQINDQILAITGRRYLAGYSDTEAEYAALMDAGVAFAQQYQLTPGVALSAEQMAQLTTDIVWFVAQPVTLADGSVQNVLVPQVYLRRPKDGDLGTGGALMAGDTVFIKTDKELTNSGRIAASRDMTLLSDGDITNAGGRISANNLYARAENDLKNLSGIIAGTGVDSQVTLLAGRDIVLSTRTIDTTSAQGARTNVDRVATVQGNQIYIKADRDLNAQGANVTADATLKAFADRNMNITSVAGSNRLDTVDSTHTVQGRGNEIHESAVTQTQSVFKAGTDATLVAGEDMLIAGSTVKAGDNVGIQGKNVTIEAKKDSYSRDIQNTGTRSYTRVAQSDEALAGGEVAAGGNILIRAASDTPGADSGNIYLSGAYIHQSSAQAGEDPHVIQIKADNDVTIDAVKTQHSRESESYRGDKGFLSSTTIEQSNAQNWEQAEGSIVSGQKVQLQAGSLNDKRGDVTIAGSQVVADEGLTITAGRHLNIIEEQEASTQSSTYSKTTSGLYSGGGAAVSLGTQQREQLHDQTSTRAAGSLVGSTSGEVTLTAGDTYTQRGSTVAATNGDVVIDAKRVVVQEARETDRASDITRTRSNGLTLALSSPVLDMLNTAQQMADATDKAKGDARANALAAGVVGLSAYNTAASMMPSATSNGGPSATVSLTYGSSRSENKQESTSDTAAGSVIKAGGNVVIKAHGGGAESDIVLQGTDVTAGGKVKLAADNRVILQAAQNTTEQHSTNSSSSAAVGVAATISSQGKMAFGLTANASSGHGKSDGSDTYYTNTHITGAQGVEWESGGDTQIRGATLSGESVKGTVGGELYVESLQDTSTYKGSQQSASGSLTLGYGASGSANYSQSGMNADWASVTEQSGIYAGAGGYQLDVAGGTHLKGAVIASDQEATKNGRNSLTTETLEIENIQNHSNVSGSSFGVGANFSVSGKDTGGPKQVGGQELMATGKSGTNTSTPTFASASEKDSSTTYSAISDGAITIRNDAKQKELTGKSAEETVATLNHDTANAQNSLTNTFDADALQAKLDIATSFQQQAGTFAATIKAQEKAAADQAEALYKQAEATTDPAQKQALLDQAQQASKDAQNLHNVALGAAALSGAAGANVLGGMNGLAQGAVVNYLQGLTVTEVKGIADSFKNADGTPNETSDTLRGILQGIVACAGAAANSQSCGTGALAAGASVALNNALNALQDTDASKLTAEERQTRSDFVAGLIGVIGAATGDASAGNTAATAARLETDNNSLAVARTSQSPYGQLGDLKKKPKELEQFLDQSITDFGKKVLTGKNDLNQAQDVKYTTDMLAALMMDPNQPTAIHDKAAQLFGMQIAEMIAAGYTGFANSSIASLSKSQQAYAIKAAIDSGKLNPDQLTDAYASLKALGGFAGWVSDPHQLPATAAGFAVGKETKDSLNSTMGIWGASRYLLQLNANSQAFGLAYIGDQIASDPYSNAPVPRSQTASPRVQFPAEAQPGYSLVAPATGPRWAVDGEMVTNPGTGSPLKTGPEGPLTNTSGALDTAANAARNQPYGNGGSASPSSGINAAGNSGGSVSVTNTPSAIQQATNLFSSNLPGTLNIGGATFAEVPNTGNAAIFSGATDAQVQQYFMALTGTTQLPAARVVPGKGTLYTVNTPSGNFTLRDFSSSSGQTGPAWTIDIPKGAVGTTYNPEIKFLK